MAPRYGAYVLQLCTASVEECILPALLCVKVLLDAFACTL